jgi:hypothetical protein
MIATILVFTLQTIGLWAMILVFGSAALFPKEFFSRGDGVRLSESEAKTLKRKIRPFLYGILLLAFTLNSFAYINDDRIQQMGIFYTNNWLSWVSFTGGIGILIYILARLEMRKINNQ